MATDRRVEGVGEGEEKVSERKGEVEVMLKMEII